MADHTESHGVSEGRSVEAGGTARRRRSRRAMIWGSTLVSLLLLILLIVFILQNQTSVQVSFLGFQGSLPLGIALLIGAVAGGLVVSVAGLARLAQLRWMGWRAAKRHNDNTDEKH